MKYIYVFAETDRDKLLDLGFLLLGQKDNASSWAFVDKTGTSIDLDLSLIHICWEIEHWKKGVRYKRADQEFDLSLIHI